jgi:hypothetical protein
MESKEKCFNCQNEEDKRNRCDECSVNLNKVHRHGTLNKCMLCYSRYLDNLQIEADLFHLDLTEMDLKFKNKKEVRAELLRLQGDNPHKIKNIGSFTKLELCFLLHTLRKTETIRCESCFIPLIRVDKHPSLNKCMLCFTNEIGTFSMRVKREYVEDLKILETYKTFNNIKVEIDKLKSRMKLKTNPYYLTAYEASQELNIMREDMALYISSSDSSDLELS